MNWAISVTDGHCKRYVRSYDSFAAIFTDEGREAWRFATREAAQMVAARIYANPRYASALIDLEQRPRYA